MIKCFTLLQVTYTCIIWCCYTAPSPFSHKRRISGCCYRFLGIWCTSQRYNCLHINLEIVIKKNSQQHAYFQNTFFTIQYFSLVWMFIADTILLLTEVISSSYCTVQSYNYNSSIWKLLEFTLLFSILTITTVTMISWADLPSIDVDGTQSGHTLTLRELYKYADGKWWAWHHLLVQVQDSKVNIIFALHLTKPVLENKRIPVMSYVNKSLDICHVHLQICT